VLGSGGRGESLLAPDQDNAIVFDASGADGQPDGDIDKWFAELATRLSETLDQAGIPLCKGGVMARNAQWRGSFETWQSRIAEWIGKSRPDDLLNVDIFFDMAAVHGDFDLGQQLFSYAYVAGASNPIFAKLLGDGLAAPDPFTLMGGLRLEDGRIDLKSHGLFPIVNLARSLSIRHGHALHSTSERLEALAGTTGGRSDLEALDRAHAVLLAALLHQQALDIEAGLPPTNRLDPKSIPKDQLERLKRALRHVGSVPDLVRDLMFD
jgi:DNA polymerase-3 subunit epsilon/CBS domain-containing protein